MVIHSCDLGVYPCNAWESLEIYGTIHDLCFLYLFKSHKFLKKQYMILGKSPGLLYITCMFFSPTFLVYLPWVLVIFVNMSFMNQSVLYEPKQTVWEYPAQKKCNFFVVPLKSWDLGKIVGGQMWLVKNRQDKAQSW